MKYIVATHYCMLCKKIFYNTLIALDEIILGRHIHTEVNRERVRILVVKKKKDTTVYFIVGFLEVSSTETYIL